MKGWNGEGMRMNRRKVKEDAGLKGGREGGEWKEEKKGGWMVERGKRGEWIEEK